MGGVYFHYFANAILLVSVVTSVSARVCVLGTEPDPESGKIRLVLSPGDPCTCSQLVMRGHNVYAPPMTQPSIYLDVAALDTVDAQGIRRLFHCVADGQGPMGHPQVDTTTPETTAPGVDISASPFAPHPTPIACSDTALLADCQEIREAGNQNSGLHTICLNGQPLLVYCDMEGNNSHIVIQRRLTGFESFTRDWEEYVDGFGDLNKEFWLGNENLRLLTDRSIWELTIDLGTSEGNTSSVTYGKFGVTGSRYELIIGDFYLNENQAGDSMSQLSGAEFSANPVDNDDHPTTNCAKDSKSGWWFADCAPSCNLNGVYPTLGPSVDDYKGIKWESWLGSELSLKMSEMKIRPIHYDTVR